MKIVMIADDSPVIRKVARRLLEDVGFVVVEATDGAQAIAACRQNMPDVVIVDWDLPGKPGLDVIADIARLPAAAQTTLLYCTSQIKVAEMTRAKRAGAKGFLMKPFNRQMLMAKLAEVGITEMGSKAA